MREEIEIAILTVVEGLCCGIAVAFCSLIWLAVVG